MRRSPVPSLLLLAAYACDPGARSQPPRTSPQPAVDDRQPTSQAPAPAPAAVGLHAVLVVDWAAVDRLELQTMLAEGRAILVRVDGERASLELGCRGDVAYTFKARNPRSERLTVDGATLDATIAGTWSAAPPASRHGTCDGVTHAATAIDAGAFTVSSSTSTHTRTEVPFGGGGVVGGSSSSSSSSTTSDGDPAACAAVTQATPRPPVACNAVIRLHLTPAR